MMKFKKKPVVINAIQYTGDNFNFIRQFVGSSMSIHQLGDNTIAINTLEGVMNALPGDFIIKGIKGEFYPCKPDIFEKTYEKVEE